MEQINKVFDKLLEKVHGGIYAIISMAFGVSLIFIAMSQFPGYNMVEYYISNLGAGPGLSGPLFNIGLILAGIIAIPFFVHLGRILKQEGIYDIVRKLAVGISVIGCVCLSIVGCFPATHGFSLLMHYYFAMGFFFSGLLFCFLFSVIMYKDSKYSKIQVLIGFFVAVTFAFFLIVKDPLPEWIVFFSIVFWVLENGIYIFYKKF